MEKKEVWKINESAYKFCWNNFMSLKSLAVSKGNIVEAIGNFPQNIINIDTNYGILYNPSLDIKFQSDNTKPNKWFLCLDNCFYSNIAMRCQSIVYQEYEIIFENEDIYLILQENPQFETLCEEINDDEIEHNYEQIMTKEFNDNVLNIFLADKLSYYTYDNKNKIKVLFLDYELVKIKSKAHDIFYNTNLVLYYEKNAYYYSEVQNYKICCGGGSYNYVQMPTYDKMVEFDFWNDR